MVTRTQAIDGFLKAKAHPDLAALYNFNMEVQVNVAQGGGERVEGEFKGKKWNGWTDGLETWKPFRIPRNANIKPEYEDVEIRYNLEKHVEGIGLTGWDWKNCLSRWVAFDFDAIAGHSENHTKKLSDQELCEVKEAVTKVSWATIRKSTGGNGLHIYVFLDPPIPTKTHTEHAALGRSILGMLAAETGKDLQAKVDACGQNMWVWHRKMTGTAGLTLEKTGVPLTSIPENWRDHVEVVTGHRRRVMPEFLKGSVDAESLFEELSGQRSRTPLDDDHKRLLAFIKELNYSCWFDSDNNMLVTHTYALKQAHEQLSLKGIFETTSKGQDATHNCFAYPLRNGAWVVRRYTLGVAEEKTWDQDRNGWTRCFFNKEPDLKTAAAKFGGIERPTGGYSFREAESAILAAQSLGAQASIPAYMSTRPCVLKETKDGRVVIELEHRVGEDRIDDLRDWVNESKKWKKIFTVKRSESIGEVETGNFDDIVRHLVDNESSDAGWTIKSEGVWRDEPMAHVSLFLKGLNLSKDEIQTVLGSSMVKCWKIINAPFESEYPGDRCWNRKAPQFCYPPSQDLDHLSYPTWNAVLNHIGRALDPYVQVDPWARSGGLKTGSDYLKCWIASVFQHPTEPLPYLFLYGDQETGKSSLHEALSLLVTKGVTRADHALADSKFNGELEGAVICVVEETDFSSKNKTVYNLIKDWVTARQLPISRKYETPYTIDNTTHWIQCSNDISAVPVFPGDSRITMIRVDPLEAQDHVPKRILLEKLKKEAPDFLAEILNLDIPDCNSRLFIPVLNTPDKRDIEASNRTALQQFLEDKCYQSPGKHIKFSEFYDVFYASLDSNEATNWTKNRVSREIPINKFVKGRIVGFPDRFIGNISFTQPSDEDLKADPFVCNTSGVLVKIGSRK